VRNVLRAAAVRIASHPVALVAALLSLAAIWPLVASRAVPVCQQDWSWPIARAFTRDWISSFLGQWSIKGLGQPNLLPLETYLSLGQYALITIAGPALGLAFYLAFVCVLAMSGMLAMLRSLNLRVSAWQCIPAVLYAFGPVMYTRVQAGHLAYILAYALLPWLFVLTRRVLGGERRAVIWLGCAYAVAASQLQFLVYGLVVVAAAAVYDGRYRHVTRLAGALSLGIVLQLQGLLPLLTGGARFVYAEEHPVVEWEQNLSARPASAAVMLGYFPHYYEHAAGTLAPAACWLLLVAGALAALALRRRCFAVGITLWVVGLFLCSGLYGPLAGPLQYALTTVEPAAAFRDLQYAAAFTALGICVLVGAALDAIPLRLAAAGCAAATAVVIAPSVAGFGLAPLLVPGAYVRDSEAVLRIVAARGPGRVLWLPSEEPVTINGRNAGLDLALYGSPANPAANQERDIRMLAYAVSSVRAGRPQLDVFRRLGIRYFVARDYVHSERDESLGTGLPLAFPGISDRSLAKALGQAKGMRLIGATTHSTIFELDGALPALRTGLSDPAVLLQSRVKLGSVAILPAGARVVTPAASTLTVDPRRDWVGDFAGRWYTPWISDSIYPYVWTTSARPLSIPADSKACIVVGSNGSAGLLGARPLLRLNRHWVSYAMYRAAGVVLPRGITAVAAVSPCAQRNMRSQPLLVFEARFDSGWRLVTAAGLLTPILADGWAMAWPGRRGNRLVYLPAYEQVAGLVIGLGSLLFGLRWSRGPNHNRQSRLRVKSA
jgi:hypothetical protein